METISVCLSLLWTHPRICLQPACLPPHIQRLSSLLPNRPLASGSISLIWRWVDHHLPTAKLISMYHCETAPPPIPANTHTCTHICKYLHLSLSHLHGRWQEGGGLVRERKVSLLKEFIILRCQSPSPGEQMKRRGWEEASNRKRSEGRVCFCLVIGYQPKVCHGLRRWLASSVRSSIIILFVFRHHMLSLIVS